MITGSTGLVGSAVCEKAKGQFKNVICVGRKDLDLLKREQVFELVSTVKPYAIIHAAAFVGGIKANRDNPVQFLSDNIQMQTNIMDAAHFANVERFVFLGSSCIYPRDCKQPILEDYLMTGPLEETNRAYAVAKIAGIELINSYRRQFKRKWFSLMPTNIFGPGDNFNVDTGHVLASLIARFTEAVETGLTRVTLWGTGTPKREFLHSFDLADAILFTLDNYDDDIALNVGSGYEISIRDLAMMVAEVVGFQGKIVWDSSLPDGTPRKLLDSTRIRELGWTPKMQLFQGVQHTYTWYLENRSERK
jgi:GDP-L-fucose synthase